MPKKLVISGTGTNLPEHPVSNQEMVDAFARFTELYNNEHRRAITAGEEEALTSPYTAEDIEQITGIRGRRFFEGAGILDPSRLYPRIAAELIGALSRQVRLSVPAVREALEQAGKTPGDVDLVVVAVGVLERQFPAISIELKQEMGFVNAYCIDLQMGCASAIHGMQTVIDALLAGRGSCGLVVVPETASFYKTFKDKTSYFLGGDGIAAIVIETFETATAEPLFEILDTKYTSSFSSAIYLRSNAMVRLTDTAWEDNEHFNGPAVFKSLVRMTHTHLVDQFEEFGLAFEDIHRYWFHQANLRLNHALASKLVGKIYSFERVPHVIDKYGNTGASGVLIAMHEHKEMPVDSLGLICVMGAGFAIGSMILRRVR